MPEITVTVTDAENKALEYAAASVQDWCDNAIKVRAAAATDEIIGILVAHCNANDITIATGQAAQIDQAYELDLIMTGAERLAAAEQAAGGE
jgi:hypothetical protein|tara:strand:+ start:1086 stop:1361 length:276 start_codon:yes stop_codon:yes gene_type:complete